MGVRRSCAVVGVLVLAGLAGCGGGGAESARAGHGYARGRRGGGLHPAAARLVSPVDQVFGVGDAQQVITVIADAPGDTTATLTAYERSAAGWVQVHGPWRADIGAEGFAPAGEKREGDGRTPTGAYGFDFAFGVLADPGVRLDYRRVTSDAIVWDDDPTSGRYNEWVDSSTESPGRDPEPMYNQPVYDYGVVIDYNPAATPGLGSAIFLHVSKETPTAGCVAIARDDLVALMRWIDPAKRPRIVMGTHDALTP